MVYCDLGELPIGFLPEMVYEACEEPVVGVVSAIDDEAPVKEACQLRVVPVSAYGLPLDCSIFRLLSARGWP